MKQAQTHIDVAVGFTSSPLGKILLAADASRVLSISLRAKPEQVEDWLSKRIPDARFIERAEWLAPVKDWLAAYFAGKHPAPNLLKPGFLGTDFQVAVWRELARLPYDALITYGELGQRVGCASGRAIGQAVGHNPLPILVPCHRVVAANRRLGGFSSGLDHKRHLLAHEGFRVAGEPEQVYLTKGTLL